MRKRKVSISTERSVYTFGYLHSAASWALEQAEGTKEGQFHFIMQQLGLLPYQRKQLHPFTIWDKGGTHIVVIGTSPIGHAKNN